MTRVLRVVKLCGCLATVVILTRVMKGLTGGGCKEGSRFRDAQLNKTGLFGTCRTSETPGGGGRIFVKTMKIFWMTILLAVGGWTAGWMNSDRGEARETTSSEESLQQLEWRGILALPGEVLFSLHDRETKESFWIGLNQVMAEFEVVAYHEEENELTVRHGTVARTFSLSGSTVLALEEGVPEVSIRGEDGEDGPANEVAETDSSLEAQPTADASTEDVWEGQEEEVAETSDPWGEAIENLPALREVDRQFQALDAAEDEVNDTLARSGPGEADYEAASEKRYELWEQRRLLTELALTQLRDSPSLSEEMQEALAEELRADYASRVSSPRPPSVEPSDNGRPTHGVP
jgi:hypothetical protein